MVIRKRLDLKGPALAFITTTVYEWQHILTLPEVIPIIINEINNFKEIYNISIISYVIMPSHIHLLLGFPQIEKLSKTIQAFKSITSRQVKEFKLFELRTNSYNLWKQRFDDLIIVSEKQLKIKIEYIHNNPVKTGLVNLPESWEYSSASDWLTDECGLVTIDKEFRWLLKY